MIYYLKGVVQELTPTYAVVEVGGVGYYVSVSLNTSQKLQQGRECLLYTQQIIREDAHLLFGFYEKAEKEMFNLLSSLDLAEISRAILSGNSGVLQKVKGVGAKTAERIIIDLRDKVQKFEFAEGETPLTDNKVKEEALSALEVLGIPRKTSEKIMDKVLKQAPETSTEELVKQVLKNI